MDKQNAAVERKGQTDIDEGGRAAAAKGAMVTPPILYNQVVVDSRDSRHCLERILKD